MDDETESPTRRGAAPPGDAHVAGAPRRAFPRPTFGALRAEGPLADTFFDPLPEEDLRAWEGEADDACPAAQGAARQGPRARRRAHDWIDERTRALHAAIAAHLRRDPTLLRVAVANLDRFEPGAAPGARWAYAEWRRLLRELAFDDLLAFLVSEDERATELRQSTPFFGILPPAERDALFAHFETL